MRRALGCGVLVAGFVLLPPLMMAGLIGWADMSVAGSEGATAAGVFLLVTVLLWFASIVGLIAMAMRVAKERGARNRPGANQ